MTRVLLDDLEPGMILEDAVKNANGSVLLAAGATLTEKHIRAMKMWGIIDIGIKGGGDSNASDGDDIDPALIEKAKSDLSPMFIHANLEHPIMDEIFTQAVTRHARNRS